MSEKEINVVVVCVIYDSVADLHSAPMVFTNQASAVRYFANKCKSDTMGTAKDLELYHIAYYNDKNAALVALDKQVKLARGLDYVKEED